MFPRVKFRPKVWHNAPTVYGWDRLPQSLRSLRLLQHRHRLIVEFHFKLTDV
jgi:hypothetical protein